MYFFLYCSNIFPFYTFVFNCSRLNFEEYNLLTSKIIALFPSESTYTYFVPAITKNESRTGKPILAKGKLVNKVRNILFISPDTVQCKRKRKSTEMLETPTIEITGKYISSFNLFKTGFQ